MAKTAMYMAARAATLDSRATPGNTVGDGYLPSPGMTGGGHGGYAATLDSREEPAPGLTRDGNSEDRGEDYL